VSYKQEDTIKLYECRKDISFGLIKLIYFIWIWKDPIRKEEWACR